MFRIMFIIYIKKYIEKEKKKCSLYKFSRKKILMMIFLIGNNKNVGDKYIKNSNIKKYKNNNVICSNSNKKSIQNNDNVIS